MTYKIVGENLVITIPLRKVNLADFQVAEKAEPVLTPKQTQVFDLLRQSKVAKEIATELSISTRTAKFHIGDVYRKCKVTNRYEFMEKY